ncbi:hypothetical protein CPC08DRAFT_706201 [Agrocybe pediades]|nr:hypothetical protein CPC08DRAFT_706201 [Agrocybe pediades]
MSTRGTSILSPFTSLRRACRDIWNKRAESLSTVDAAVVVLHGNSSIHEPDIKAHGVPLSPSPERRYPSILRKLFDARPSSKRDKTATGIDAETEIGAYRCMLLFEARYQTRMDIPRRIRRKLEPLLAEEIEYQRKLAKMDDSDWTSRIAVPPNQPSESPIRIPISVPNTGPETVSIRNVRSAVTTLSPSSPPTLPLPSAAAVASAPEQVESLQSHLRSAEYEKSEDDRSFLVNCRANGRAVEEGTYHLS